MRRPLIKDGVVVNVIIIDSEDGYTPPDGHVLGPEGGEIGDAWDGESYSKPPEPEREPPTLDHYESAIQAHIDATAREKKYADGYACSTYVSSTIPQWAAEAQAFVAWRDAVWGYAFTEMDKVENEQREQPSIETFIGDLPEIEWPDA